MQRMHARKVVEAVPRSPYAPNETRCCFCGRFLGKKAALEVIVVYADESWQPMWGHARCLRSKLHPSFPLACDEEKRPNKAPEPTPPSVIPRANESKFE